MSAAFVDVLVVTSSPEELGGVLALGDGGEAGWAKRKAEDGSTYHVREFENARGKTFVMAATWAGAKDISTPDDVFYGTGQETLDRVAQLIQEMAPSWLAFPGLCTGFSADRSLGDVLFATGVCRFSRSYAHPRGGESYEVSFRYRVPDALVVDAPTVLAQLRLSDDCLALRPKSIQSQESWLLHQLYDANENPAQHPDRRVQCPDWAKVIVRLRENLYLKSEPGSLTITSAGRQRVEEERLLHPEGLPTDTPLRVHTNWLASLERGSNDAKLLTALRSQVSDVRGIDERTVDFAHTAQQLGKPFLIIKTIVDYPGREPFPDYVPYGVRASAECLLHALQHIFTPEERSVPLGPLSQRDTYLQSITIENFKSIRRLQLDFLQKSALDGYWTCIAGINGAGKSAILQAITMVLLGDKLTNDLGLKLVPRTMRITPEGRCPAEIRARVRSGNDELDLFLPIGADGINERLLQDEPGYSKMIDFWNTRKRGHVLLAYGAGRNLSEYVDKRHKDKDDETQRQMTLFDPLAQVASVDVLLEQDKRAKPILDMLKTLLNVVLVGTELSVDEDESKLTFRCGDVALPAFELPDGFRSTIAWLADICATWIAKAPKEAQDGDPSKIRGIVLIDEIDLHLHASLQRVLVPNLRKALPHVQWIVTTHSPLVVASFDRHEIVLLQSTPEGPQRKPIDRQILGFSSDEVYQYLMGTEPHSAALEDKLAAGDGGADLVHILAQSPTVNEEKAREQRARLDALARAADEAEENGLSNEDDT